MRKSAERFKLGVHIKPLVIALAASGAMTISIIAKAGRAQK